jgi:hypothetical protein
MLLPGVGWLLRGLVVLALVTSAPQARAGLQDTVTLSWQAPEGCPDGQFVLARVSKIAGEQSPRELSVHVTARIERAGAGFRLWLEMTEGTARWHQQFEDPSCAQLAETASVVIALAVGHERSEPAVQSEQLASTDLASGSSPASGSVGSDTAAEPAAEPVLPAWGLGIGPLARRTSALAPRQAASFDGSWFMRGLCSQAWCEPCARHR